MKHIDYTYRLIIGKLLMNEIEKYKKDKNSALLWLSSYCSVNSIDKLVSLADIFLDGENYDIKIEKD